MPTPSGLTVAAPETTWSLIPSFGYGVVAAAPNTRGAFDSFSQRSALGNDAVGAGRAVEPVAREAVVGNGECRPSPSIRGREPSSPYDQVLRNQSVGSTCSVASSGP